jgi:hypothetical protein
LCKRKKQLGLADGEILDDDVVVQLLQDRIDCYLQTTLIIDASMDAFRGLVLG